MSESAACDHTDMRPMYFALSTIFLLFPATVPQGGGADYFHMRRRFKGLWPYMSQDDLRVTEKWAFLENLRIFQAERTAMERLAKNMRERRAIGHLMLDLDRSLTLTATEFQLTAAIKSPSPVKS